MSYYCEFTTVAEIRAEYLDVLGTADDLLLLKEIRDVSRQHIEGITNRRFAPRIETRLYDVPPAALNDNRSTYGSIYPRTVRPELRFDDDLLALTTLSNGDGTAIASTEYLLTPANGSPKQALRLKLTSNVAWLTDSLGNSEQVISVLGVWGFHEDYSNAWVDTGATVQDVGGINASIVTLTAQKGLIKAGQLLKIDSEFIYCLGVANKDATTDTVTIVRGANGSTAATHANATTIFRWDFLGLADLTKRAVVAFYKLRNNPVGDTVVVNGMSFVTPKDVTQYIAHSLDEWGGMTWEGFA